MTNKEKFQDLVSEQDSSVMDEIKWRIANRKWLQRSQAIALRILTRLDELNITQKELACKIGVSAQMINKWVKGKENLTLETIAKLEEALGIELMSVTGKE